MPGRGPAVVRRRPASAAACGASTCSPGATSTIRTPAGRRCTPTSSCAAGPRPGSNHAPHVGGDRRNRRPHDATATTWSAGGAGTPCSPGRSPARSAGRWVATTPSSRSGTACRGSHPMWRRTPGITFLHHVHGPMWDQILPGPLASFGRALEARLAPPFYRRGLTVDPVRRHPRRAARTRLPTPIASRRSPTAPIRCSVPAGTRRPNPSIVAVGRLAPVKRFELLIDSARHRPPYGAGSDADDRRGRARARRAARPRRATGRRRLDPLRRPGRPRTSSSICTGRRGSSPAARWPRAGA